MNKLQNQQAATVLLSCATESLRENIETVGSKRYLTAGRHQFRSLWSRDFCYSTRALLKLGEFDVVRDQLSLYIELRRKKDALIPRAVDSISPKKRVVRQVFARFLGESNYPIEESLHAEYLSENGTAAIDSNILLILAALSYLHTTQDFIWWKQNESVLVEIFKYYDAHKRGALIVQPPYSDWQDSVKREGCAFLTNLFYWAATSELIKFPAFGIQDKEPSELRVAIEITFRDPVTGLFRSMEGREPISIDGNLLALDLEFVRGAEAQGLFESLQMHSLWKGRPGGPPIPGFVTYPDYPKKEVSWTTRLIGLRHYHDEIYWTWLMGLSLKIALRFDDIEKSAELLKALVRTTKRDGAVGEIYAPNPDLALWSSPWLTAEKPFSWGSAYVVDALI
jgi:hypothetical protein